MHFEELRKKHTQFIYNSYSYKLINNQLDITFDFLLEPDIHFYPHLSISLDDKIDIKQYENLIFHIGLIEMISYWKCACSPKIIIKAGTLDQDQIDWLRNIFIHGLGEFFYKNTIDFTVDNFLTISCEPSELPFKKITLSDPSGDLILASGGKDSVAALEILKDLGNRTKILTVNPTQSTIENIQISGYSHLIIAKRTLDPKLFELNSKGYLNGHTPFSAYLSFLGIFIGGIYNFENVIVSNERSASEGNVEYHGIEANHQYSKGFEFEESFREYTKKYLIENSNYFSFLRPLFDLQIGALFSKSSKHLLSFKSCNVNQSTNSWCGACAKCAFVYLILFPFLDYEKMMAIFGSDYFKKPEIMLYIRQLVGIEENKPFECVGTKQESIIALKLCINKYKKDNKNIPESITTINNELDTSFDIIDCENWLKIEWDEKNNLPLEYADILKNKLKSL